MRSFQTPEDQSREIDRSIDASTISPDDMFLVFRVYDLSTDSDDEPGVQIYVDSCKLFEEGVLHCEAVGWLVGPA